MQEHPPFAIRSVRNYVYRTEVTWNTTKFFFKNHMEESNTELKWKVKECYLLPSVKKKGKEDRENREKCVKDKDAPSEANKINETECKRRAWVLSTRVVVTLSAD